MMTINPDVERLVAQLEAQVSRALHSLAGALNALYAATREIQVQARRVEAGETSVHLAQVLSVVAAEWGVAPSRILGRSKMRVVASARFSAMALYYESRRTSLAEVGETFGGRDHGTASHALRKAAEYCENDRDFRERHERARQVLGLITAKDAK